MPSKSVTLHCLFRHFNQVRGAAPRREHAIHVKPSPGGTDETDSQDPDTQWAEGPVPHEILQGKAVQILDEVEKLNHGTNGQ